MARVFISFIHEEEEVAKAMYNLVKSKIVAETVFLSSDPRQLHAGENWLSRIQKELKSANVVILMLSPTSISRPWVNFEAGAAWLSEKTIIPVCYDGLTAEELPKPYSDLQAVDLTTFDLKGGSNYLLNSINHHLVGHDLPPTLPPVPKTTSSGTGFPPLPDYVEKLRVALEELKQKKTGA